MSWKENSPPLVVTVVWTTPVDFSGAVTCASETSAPDGSVTVPLIAPRNVCPQAAIPRDNTSTTANHVRFILRPFCEIVDYDKPISVAVPDNAITLFASAKLALASGPSA